VKTFTVKAADADVRIDVALAARLDASRARIQRLIKEGTVTVNEKPATPHTVLRAGDVVAHPPLPSLSKKAAPTVDVPILYEDENFVVVDKPAGIIVHPMNDTDKRPSVIGSIVKARPGMNRARRGVRRSGR
jgi:23S rRNA pseudouridine1911/1915/1917 synthase